MPAVTDAQHRIEGSMGQQTIWARERWQRTLTVIRAPHVRIEMFGSDEAHALHRSFTSRHPRFKVFANKRWGVALLPVPNTFDEYVAARSEMVRRKRQRAQKLGFRYALVSPMDHIEQILEINASAPMRQGRPMDSHYLDRAQVTEAFDGRTSIHGILDSRGRLCAYALVIETGEALVFSKLMGHADVLQAGVMYLLVSEVVHDVVDLRRTNSPPTWLMYDTFWGASRGLAYFKERLGFRPFTVEWVWVDRG